MMADILNTLAYVLQHYPHKSELSNARATKLIYLGDWHQALYYGKQITSISWYFDNYGPFVSDVKATAAQHPNIFKIEETVNMFGTPKTLLSLAVAAVTPNLAPQEQASLDHVIGATKGETWDGFIKLVYSTYPVASSQRYSQLDLIAKAQEYKALTMPRS